MRQLSALDAAFLYAESPAIPMHVGALQIYDPATAPRGRVTLDDVVDVVRRRVHRIPCFHRRLVDAPMACDHPYWADERPDPRHHIDEITLPAPGGWRALCDAVGRLQASRLNRDRPLWHLTLIRGLGLPGGPRDAFAVFTRIHHAAVDGVLGLAVTLALHDLQAEPTEPEGAGDLAIEPPPDPGAMLARAVSRQLAAPQAWWNGWHALRTFPPAEVAPRTVLNRPVSADRWFDVLEMPLDVLLRIRATVPGATVNDVLLALVGGALRRYLIARGELPERTLRSLMPVSTHVDGATDEGNSLASVTVALGTTIPDARLRLQRVHRAAADAKRGLDPAVGRAFVALGELPPAPLARQALGWAVRSRFNPLFNTVVSNLAGPSVPLYLCRAKLIRCAGLGPVTSGAGTFHVAISYCGRVTLSVTSCTGILPDPEVYMTCLQHSYAELENVR